MLDIEGMQTRGRGPRRATAADGNAADPGREATAEKGAAAAIPPAGGPAKVRPPQAPPVGRPVAASLSGRRLLLAAALVLLLPVVLVVAAVSRQQPEAPPEQTAAQFQVLAQVPDRVFRTQLERSQTINRMTGKLTAPTLLDPAVTGIALQGAAGALPTLALTGGAPEGTLPTLALTPRAVPYTLDELHRSVPAAFADLPGRPASRGALLLTANLQVPAGATLIIDSLTPDVRLTSTPSGFATIISRGTVTIAGDVTRAVRISSWDPGLGRVDRDSADGRSFILQIGGRMDTDHAVFEYLGFNLGLSSGVAWNGALANSTQPLPVKAQGDVRSSIFRHNYFGAYTANAQGMQWVGNTFADNEEYGFDPHTFSNNFLVESNVAYGNGKHGFIFSRGCAHNMLRHNVSRHNGGHGFMIDDGRSDPSTLAESRTNGSSNNVLMDNTAFDNAGSGVEIEGGTQNVVANNQVRHNYVGIRVKDDAMVMVRNNIAADNVRYGIDIRNVAGGIPVAGNTVSGSWGAVNLATTSSAVLDGNVATDVSAPVVIAGAAIRDTAWSDHVADMVRWNPMLVLWSILLGVPIVMALMRLLRAATRPNRRKRTV
jgi:parallel beta-helix repeat protein